MQRKSTSKILRILPHSLFKHVGKSGFWRMAVLLRALALETPKDCALVEKPDAWIHVETPVTINPVVESTEFAFKKMNLVQVNDEGVKEAAKYIHQKLLSESYTPRTWRTHTLHICPPEPYDPADPLTKQSLDWLFLISCLNFSFWSDKEGGVGRYGVQWREGWDMSGTKVWTGYWSLVAALNRALEEEIPITDPAFYSSETLCPDSLIKYVFRRAIQSREDLPLLQDRILVMREVGFILCTFFGGSFQGFIDEFHRRYRHQGTAVELVQMVTETFPSFRDEIWIEGRRVFIWKRAQILVAETWAAFYPPPSPSSKDSTPTHPIFPGISGPAIQDLTMFADYRVPQILHHLRILTYPPALVRLLRQHTPLDPGSREEVSIRAASVVAVERVREEMRKMRGQGDHEDVSSVLIDFYLWDLAKRVENGKEKVEGIDTVDVLPAHRTRSIWY